MPFSTNITLLDTFKTSVNRWFSVFSGGIEMEYSLKIGFTFDVRSLRKNKVGTTTKNFEHKFSMPSRNKF